MLLEVKNLNKKFGSVTAANNINFKMNKNEVIGVIGANGAGKTTFCNIITGYLKADSGVILYEGENITKFNVQEIKNIGIHRSFQIPQVFENLGVLENIIITELVAKNKQNVFFENAYTKKNYQNATKLLEKFSFDVDKFKGKTVKELPQGARKVLDILIAIIGKPKVILLDEPTSGISTDEKNIVMNNILRAIKEFNISVLFIEHDMEIVEKFSERVIAFYNGEIIADDKPSKVFDQNNVKKFIIGGL
jgi:branched-chain amino acid transport system ATP-binding protein